MILGGKIQKSQNWENTDYFLLGMTPYSVPFQYFGNRDRALSGKSSDKRLFIGISCNTTKILENSQTRQTGNIFYEDSLSSEKQRKL